jgi:hypothetical protein
MSLTKDQYRDVGMWVVTVIPESPVNGKELSKNGHHRTRHSSTQPHKLGSGSDCSLRVERGHRAPYFTLSMTLATLCAPVIASVAVTATV